MTTLIHRMREELVRRNYAATTIHSYLKAVEHFSQHVRAPLDQLGPDDIRSYHAHLLEHRKLAVNTVVLNICALRLPPPFTPTSASNTKPSGANQCRDTFTR